MSKKKLNKMLKELREENNLTLAAAAERIGISVSYLHELESGEALKPKVNVLDKIAAIYCCDKDALFACAERISSDVFYKLVDNPKLMQLVRDQETN